MKDLSIIIISYNTKKPLERCLESICNRWVIGDQGLGISGAKRSRVNIDLPPVTGHQPPITEIIVVDNDSSDGSVEMVKEMAARGQLSVIRGQRLGVGGKNVHRSPVTDHRSPITTLRLIENKQNLGFAKGVNQGIRQAEGEAVFLLNSDTIVKKGALRALLDFEKRFRPVIVGAKLLNSDETIQSSVFHLLTIGRAISEYWLGKEGSFSKYFPTEEEPVEVEAVVGGAMLISKEVIEKVGLFDERYFMYFEDLDYCRRARRAGFKIWYFPEAEIIHEHGASGRTLTDGQNQWRRLTPSSKIYHGLVKHYLLSFILWTGQKFRKNQA